MKFTHRVAGTVAVTALAALAAPASAFAEESAGGVDILIPKMAEFIPALIAFLIILVVMAKLVWPKVLAMMDERERRFIETWEAEAYRQQVAKTS